VAADGIFPKRLETFQADIHDKELAQIHFEHFAKLRVKNLIRIATWLCETD